MKLIFITLIKIYQFFISPLFGNRCKFHPTCSEYAKELILTKNPIKAIFYIFIRLLKCNPLHKGGYDPIPGKFEK